MVAVGAHSRKVPMGLTGGKSSKGSNEIHRPLNPGAAP
jgi:hypothetical protein